MFVDMVQTGKQDYTAHSIILCSSVAG